MGLEESGPVRNVESSYAHELELRWAERRAAREWDDDGRLIKEIPFIDAGPGLCGRCGQYADTRSVAQLSRSGRTWTSSRTAAACRDCLLPLIDLGYDVVHPRRWPERLPEPRSGEHFLPADRPVHAAYDNPYDGIVSDAWEAPGYHL